MKTILKNGVWTIFLLALISCSPDSEPAPTINQPPFVNEPPAINNGETIGFIGCSNTGQTIEGYHAVGGTRIWAVERSISINQGMYPPFGGGTPNRWAEDNSPYWPIFDEYLSLHPDTKTVWWQLCIKKTDVFTYATAHTVLETLRERIPGVTVYVSPLPPFTDHVCGITGKEGFQRMYGLAKQIAEREEDVLPGPLLPGIQRSENVQDGCHMNEAGKRKVGESLKAFFDN